MFIQNTLRRLRDTFKSQRSAARRRTCKLEFDRLEDRLAPVVGANANAALVAEGTGYDGVVQLQWQNVTTWENLCTGSLLTTGRHILTAAHCLTDTNGTVNQNSVRVVFHLPNRPPWLENVSMIVPRADFILHTSWTGNAWRGNDIAILRLPALAPSGPRGVGADRYDVYRGTNEVGQDFRIVGYGNRGTGTTGQVLGTGGTKRTGLNRWDSDGNRLGGSPMNMNPAPAAGLTLAYDFDNGQTNNDAFGRAYSINNTGLGANEANQSQGDSGGPAFIGSAISGVVSFSRQRYASPPDIDGTGNNTFGEFAVMTRASSHAGWVDIRTSGVHELILDMDKQNVGWDNTPDTIEVRKGAGEDIQLWVNGLHYHTVGRSFLNRLVIRGGVGNDTLRVQSQLIGLNIAFDGRGGANHLIVDATSSTNAFAVEAGEVRAGGGFASTFTYQNTQQVTVNGRMNDTVNVYTTSVPVTVAGASAVVVGRFGRLADIRGAVTVSNQPNYTALTIDNSADSTTRTATLTGTGLTGLSPAPINWVQNDIRSLTIHGGNGLNTYHVVNTPQNGVTGGVTTTLYCGTGLDTVNLLATTGVINLFGGGGADAVNLGNNGNMAGILGSMTISNTGGHRTRVLINDSNRGGNFPAVTLDNYTTDAEYIRLTGLTPATIYSRCRDTQDYTLRTGTGAVTANVLSTCPISSSLALVGNSANTTVNVGRAGRLTDIRGRVHFDSAVAGGALVINNAADTIARTVTVTSNSVSFGNPDATINWNRLSSLTVNGGTSSDTFVVNGTAASVLTTLNSGGGLDTFEVGNGTLAGIAGRIRVNGGAFARVNDSSGTAGRYYTWDGTTVAWDAVIVETANVGFVSLIGGQGDDLYGVYVLGPINLIVSDAAGADTLAGPNAATTWRVTGTNAGNLGPAASFGQIEYLIGNAGDDTFAFAEGASVSGYLDGGAGVNTLDYSAWTTGVYADLFSSAATGAALVSNFTHAVGGAGDDYLHGDWQDNRLVGNGGHDILVGDEGNDTLQGGAGHDQLYGGGGADRLEGGAGDDLVLDGWTLYDYDVGALNTIWTEWTNGASYESRMEALRPLLNADSVFSDYDADEVYGQEDRDWFWATEGFDVTDRLDPDEVLN